MAAALRCTGVPARSLTAQPARHQVGTGSMSIAGGDLTMCPAGGNDPHGRPRLTAATHPAATTGLGAEAELEPPVDLGSRGAASSDKSLRCTPTSSTITVLSTGCRTRFWAAASGLTATGQRIGGVQERHRLARIRIRIRIQQHGQPAALERSSDGKQPPCSPRRRRRSSRWERACAPAVPGSQACPAKATSVASAVLAPSAVP